MTKGTLDNHSGEEEASVVLYAPCRVERACLCWDGALTEEDQRCRNGQMRNSKKTVGYMVDICVSRHGGRMVLWMEMKEV